MIALREEARQKLHVYMSRTGLALPQIAARLDLSPHSLRQFSSFARYGDGEGEPTARRLLDYFAAHPVPFPELPGKLYPTQATREIDALLEHIRGGGWGVLYGPSGAQKSFLLEYRAAEAAREAEPSLVYIRTSPSGMTPTVFLRRIAAALAAPYGQYLDGIRQNLLAAIRARGTSVGILLDEADALYRFVETLETVRELGDLLRARAQRPGLGILIAGNERVMEIFRDRPGVYFEKWRARVEQRGLRVLGPSVPEAEVILRGELGELKPAAIATILEGCVAHDPLSKRDYVNMHRLFNNIRSWCAKRGKPN